jgi:hypothetical protein
VPVTPLPEDEPLPAEPGKDAQPVEPAPVEPAPVEPAPAEPVVAEPIVAEPPVVEAAPEAASPVVEAERVLEAEQEPESDPVELAVESPETRLRLGGLKGGVNAGRFFGKVKGQGVNFGLALGAFLRIKLGDELTLQPEFLMTDKGSDVKGLVETMSEALLFIEIPVLVRYDFYRSGSLRFYGLGGPSLAYLIDANTVPEDERATVDLALHAGLGFEMALTHHDVNFELRAGQGIRNLMRDGSGLTARASVMSLYAGISL